MLRAKLEKAQNETAARRNDADAKAIDDLRMLSEALAPAGAVGDELRMRIRRVPNVSDPGSEVYRYLTESLSWISDLQTQNAQAQQDTSASSAESAELAEWKKKYADLKEEIDMVWETNAQLQDALKVWMETKGIRSSG